MANSEIVLNGTVSFLFITDFWGRFLCFFTKGLDKLLFFLYNDSVMELDVVQEAFSFCFYILVSAFAEQKANEEYG